jgi:hypothetical protein
MINGLTVLSVALSLLGMLMVVAIGVQRRRLALHRQDYEARATRLRRHALDVIDGAEPDEAMDGPDLEVLCELVGRYSRHVSGSGSRHATEYFDRIGVTAAHMAALESGIAARRAKAIVALGHIGALDAAPQIRRLLDDDDPDVRDAAAGALGRLRATCAADALAHAAAAGAIPRTTAAIAFHEIGPSALPALGRLADDEDAAVRAIAIELIGLVGSAGDDAVPQRRLYDDVPAVRRAAVTALGRVAGREAAARVRETLLDPAPEVRAAAAHALGRIGGRAVVDDLVHLASHDAFEVAHAAAQALVRIDPARVTAARDATGRSPALCEASDLIAIGAA